MDESVSRFLKSKQVGVIQEDIESKLTIWKQWYRGKVDKFHQYKIYSGESHITKERKTLNMAMRVCQDWADLLLNEKVSFTVSDEYTQTVLDRLLKQVNFYVRGNNLVEASFALGGGFFIQYFDGKKTCQKYVTQDFMYPISFDSGILTEAAFSSTVTIKSKKYIYLEVHTIDPVTECYVIDNFILKSESGVLKEMPESFYDENELQRKVITHSKTPLFQMIRPNVANRESFDSPFGTSVFSGAADVFKTCDIVYDAYASEIELGRKRIFAKDSVTNVHYKPDGTTIRAFDPHDEVFYLIPGEEDEDGNKPIVECNMQLRINELDAALQTQLNLISQSCGFGSNGYKWDKGNVTTATQVISENSEMFRTLKKHELILRPAVIDMAHGLLYFEKEFAKDTRINLEASITVDFDDSIIEDTGEKKRQALLDYQNGLIDAIEYYKTVYGMDDKQATEFYKKLQSRKPEIVEEPEGA